MTAKTGGLLVAACVLAAIAAGCASADGQTMAAAKTGKVEKSNKFCTWEFEYALDGSGKVQKGSVEVTKGKEHCTVEVSTGDLYIGEKGKEKKIRDISAAEFITEGSCRRCYIDSGGNMTCIVYPSC